MDVRGGRRQRYRGVEPSRVGAEPIRVGVEPIRVGVEPGMVGIEPSMVGVKPSMAGFEPRQVGVVASPMWAWAWRGTQGLVELQDPWSQTLALAQGARQLPDLRILLQPPPPPPPPPPYL